MTAEEITQRLQAGLPGARVDVKSDDNTHFEALVVDEAFAGMRPLARHQRVYQVLGGSVGREIHALALKTVTPEEFATLRGAD